MYAVQEYWWFEDAAVSQDIGLTGNQVGGAYHLVMLILSVLYTRDDILRIYQLSNSSV